MQPTFPCPNPNCIHTFSADSIQGISSLVCPKCGTVFRFSSASIAQSRPSGVEKTQSRVTQPAAEPEGFDFDSTSEVVTPRTRRSAKKRSYAGCIVAVLAGTLAVAAAVWGGMWLRHFLKESSREEEPALGSAFNARFVPPGKPWQRDKEIQQRLHVHIGMKSPEESSNLALLFKDYKDRMPSEAEMVDEAVGKLRSYFRGLEWEPSTKEEQTLVELPAQVCKFQGEDTDQVMMNGECYMLAFRGYGYWFFTWAPLSDLEKDREAIQAEWARLRQRFRLLDGRKGWKAKAPETEEIAGKRAKYHLTFVKGLWTREAIEGEDSHVDLLLKGREPDPEHRPLAAKDASVLVFVLPKQRDLKSATASGLDFLKQRETTLYERTAWKAIKDKDGAVDRDAGIGTERGHLSKLHVNSTEDLERYFAVAVVNRPEGVIVLVGDCLWERRDFWDQEFTALFRSFTAR